jgi:DNA-binding NarL/FixJ family response regulator
LRLFAAASRPRVDQRWDVFCSTLLIAGARPRRDALHGRDALTASELRVALMAAEGMTNREIAQALFVTTKTVETHLHHAFQKLDVDSRTQLGAALAAPRGRKARLGTRLTE